MGLPMPPGFPLLVVEGIITVLTGVVALSLLFVSPTPRQFFERDPTLSFAYVTQSVPTWMLVVISIIAPLLIIAALHCPIMCRSCRVPNVVSRHCRPALQVLLHCHTPFAPYHSCNRSLTLFLTQALRKP